MHLFATGVCEVDGLSMLYAVTEYAEEVLADILPERPLSTTEAWEMIGPVLDALAWIHGKGFVHGHLKPTNIMVVDERLKLSGESLRIAGHPGNPPPNPSIYEAPESASGAVNPEADLWSLGVTVVEALTQRRPSSPGMNQDDPVIPSSIPHPFAEIARGCLRSNPAQRFTVADVRDALGIARQGSAPRPPWHSCRPDHRHCCGAGRPRGQYAHARPANRHIGFPATAGRPGRRSAQALGSNTCS
jgi:serine/threonine protein kinase